MTKPTPAQCSNRTLLVDGLFALALIRASELELALEVRLISTESLTSVFVKEKIRTALQLPQTRTKERSKSN